ncbi:hypothetical protein SDC9_69309 [bioreactor metagenome]|uniref:Uncharacterized protein n=1 Tax=bioreactor metagenome TaxID=1076179 RepID=A0A644Y2T3_9ZZZZ
MYIGRNKSIGLSDHLPHFHQVTLLDNCLTWISYVMCQRNGNHLRNLSLLNLFAGRKFIFCRMYTSNSESLHALLLYYLYINHLSIDRHCEERSDVAISSSNTLGFTPPNPSPELTPGAIHLLLPPLLFSFSEPEN